MLLIEPMTQSYRLAGGLLAAGRGINGSQQDEGLHVYNAILDGLKIERLFWPEVRRTVMPVTQGNRDYSVGALVDNANWVIERPENILRSGYLIPGSVTETEVPMYVCRSYVDYQQITNKGVVSSLSWVLYYKATLPTGTATIWPVPSQNFNVAIYTPGYVDEFTDVMATVLWPKGWREFIEYNGAVALHDRNPLWKMSPTVEARAQMWKARVAAATWKPMPMRSDPAALARPDAVGYWWGAREWPGGY